MYDFRQDTAWTITKSGIYVPAWLASRLGKDLFGEVTEVYFAGPTPASNVAGLDEALGDLECRKLVFMSRGEQRSGQLLDQLSAFSRIEDFQFYGSGLSDAAASHLKQFPPSLRCVGFNNTQLSDPGLHQLANHVRRSPNLTALSLTYNPGITDASIDALKTLDHLRELNVNWTSMTAEGVATLKAALAHCEVRGP